MILETLSGYYFKRDCMGLGVRCFEVRSSEKNTDILNRMYSNQFSQCVNHEMICYTRYAKSIYFRPPEVADPLMSGY